MNWNIVVACSEVLYLYNCSPSLKSFDNIIIYRNLYSRVLLEKLIIIKPEGNRSLGRTRHAWTKSFINILRRLRLIARRSYVIPTVLDLFWFSKPLVHLHQNCPLSRIQHNFILISYVLHPHVTTGFNVIQYTLISQKQNRIFRYTVYFIIKDCRGCDVTVPLRVVRNRPCYQLLKGLCSMLVSYLGQPRDVAAAVVATQDLVEQRCSEMTTPAPTSQDHRGRGRRLATGKQTNNTTTGWGGLGAPRSSVPLPALEPHGTFHQVGSVYIDVMRFSQQWLCRSRFSSS